MSIFSSDTKKIGIAVVGLGYISQAAALPAFAKTDNCRIAALVSSDQKKLNDLSERYNVQKLYSYEQYDLCLASKEVDAVYIALPNSMHKEFVIKAANAGKHILCEKPMAVTSSACREMIEACEKNNVKLMIAYRLHFEAVNMNALKAIQEGEIGAVRMVNGSFSQQVKKGDIRTKGRLGGGALYDMGIYCLNAARYFFQTEPEKAVGIVSYSKDPRFMDVDGFTGALLEFGGGRIASFVTSIGCGETSECTVIGEKGVIRLNPAFDFQVALRSQTEVEGESFDSCSCKSDQFAGELQKFAQYIIEDRPVEPDGYQGLADVIIMEAILESARTSRAVDLHFDFDPRRPDPANIQAFSPSDEMPDLVHAAPPSGN